MSRAGGAPGNTGAGGAPGSTAFRALIAVVLLTAGILAWAAVPMTGSGVSAWIAFAFAAGSAVAGTIRLILTGTGAALTADYAPARGRLTGTLYTPLPDRVWRGVLPTLITMPSPQVMIVAVLALEALHPRRPWHTAILGIALLGYLLALHLAESAAKPAVFRPQLPLIVAGICLAGISVGAAALPTGGAGAGSGWLAVLAAAAAVVAVALALPV